MQRKSATIPSKRAKLDARIAEVTGVSAQLVLGTLGVVETGLAAVGIPSGTGGVQAAIDSIARAMPG